MKRTSTGAVSMKLAGWLLLASVSVLGCDTAPSPTPAPVPRSAITSIELKDVTLADLDAAVAAEKGNVVAIDVWGTFCAPCLKRFPHFVQMHEHFAKRGLVCMSLST